MLNNTQENLYTTPKKQQEGQTSNTTTYDFLGSNDLFKAKNYSSLNINSILESDFKFKSPNKLLNIKISESPWISNQKRNSYINSFFESSPRRYSNYKLRFCDTIKQESRVTSCFGSSGRRITNAFELEKDSGISLDVKKTPVVKIDYTIAEKVEIMRERDESSEKNSIRKRRRKTSNQLKILKVEFEKDSNWTKDHITRIANTTGLSESQVYKWCWDQKKKVDEEPEKDSRMDDVRKKAIFGDSIPLYKNLVEKASKIDLDLTNVTLGKRRPFGVVNDSRVRDHVVKKIKI